MQLHIAVRRPWFLAGKIGVLVVTAITLACAGTRPEKPVPVQPPAPAALVQSYHFQRDIQPIFEAKCAACHGCYDAPCQLKLTSSDGLLRGATKLPVYAGTRLEAAPTTRLGTDALSPEAWRAKGFYPVLPVAAAEGANKVQVSLLQGMVELGHQHPVMPDQKLPKDLALGRTRQNQCPRADEFEHYAKKHEGEGMPLGVTGLSEPEYQKLSTWLAQGAVVEPEDEQPLATEDAQIKKWEAWLNRPGEREQLVARYLFEHLFAGHLYFSGEKQPHFFELLRSRTPPGLAVEPLATRRPNDEPGGPVFYRLRMIEGSIVEKNHIIYALDEQRLARYQQLFFGQPWTLEKPPAYGELERANPFLTFAAIPARARYQFMLDNAHFFVRNFIRGPVCAGQAATDVIRDQFWVSFENPARELYVNDATYRAQVSPLLGVAGQDSKLIKAGTEWRSYRKQRNEYIRLRQKAYRQKEPEGPVLHDLWDGDGHNPDAALTIFRHHDNAFVQHGLIGALPETLWVMDYPLLERTYYELVVNFDVFGNASHQLQTRLYFDLIRNDGETNFLRFLPPALRNPLLHNWYQAGGRAKLFTTYADIDTTVPTRLKFGAVKNGEAAKALYVKKLQGYMQKILGPDDVINRCPRGDCKLPGASAATLTANRALRPLSQKTGAELPLIPLLPELVLVRVRGEHERLVYSLIHNRAHSNVAFINGEDKRLQPERDTLSVMPGVYGNYPNFAFDLPLAEIEHFASQLAAVRDAAGLEAVVEQWGVRRSSPEFWNVFHDFTQFQRETEPLEAGILDMNRYENL